MAGKLIGALLGSSGLVTDVDATQRNPLGLVAQDDGGNQFIYLLGVASVASGDWVVYNGSFATTRALNTPVTGPVAVAIAAVVASKWGWFQIVGKTYVSANIETDSGGAGKSLFLGATAGRLTTTVASGLAVIGAWASGNPASNTGFALINRPSAVGFTLASA